MISRACPNQFKPRQLKEFSEGGGGGVGRGHSYTRFNHNDLLQFILSLNAD